MPRNYEKIAKELLQWSTLSVDEIIRLAGEFVQSFVDFMLDNGIKLEEHTALEELTV